MPDLETKSYRVKFSSAADAIELAGIVDRPKHWPPENASPRPGVVVYSHCFTCSKDLKATVRISRALAKSGVAVLRFDMRGLGGSTGDFSTSNFTTNLQDLAAAIRFADTELGPVTGLVGHSFGGIASLVTAGNASRNGQSELQHLAFVATIAAPSDTQHLATLLARMNPAIETEGVGSVSIGGVDWTIRDQMLADFRAHDVTPVLSDIRCPVLLMHSPVDQTVGVDHAFRLISLIQTERDGGEPSLNPVSLVSLPGADHLLVSNPKDLQFVSDLLSSWCRRY